MDYAVVQFASLYLMHYYIYKYLKQTLSIYLLATAWDSHYNVDHRVSEHQNAGSVS